MLLCWFSAKGTGKFHCIVGQIVRALYYEILDDSVLPSVRILKMGCESVFQRNDAPKHTGIATRKRLLLTSQSVACRLTLHFSTCSDHLENPENCGESIRVGIMEKGL